MKVRFDIISKMSSILSSFTDSGFPSLTLTTKFRNDNI